jgi:hypothetical protein
MVERAAGGVGGEGGGGFAVARDIAAADPGAFDDPLVGGVDLCGELGIVDAADGEGRADPGDC